MTEPIARITIGIVIPASIDFGGKRSIVPVPADERLAIIAYAEDTAAQWLRIAGVEMALTIVTPDRFTLPLTGDFRVQDQNAAAREFRRVGLTDQYARVLLVPDTPGLAFTYGGTSWGADNGDRMTLVRGMAGEYRIGRFGVRGCVCTHELMHTVEWSAGTGAGITLGYGKDTPLVHDGGGVGGKHVPQYPVDKDDRFQWRWLRDLMTARVPHPTRKGQTYGYSEWMWRRLFPLPTDWPPDEATPPRSTAPDPIPAWTTDELNLRSGAGTSFPVLSVIPADTELRVIDRPVDGFARTAWADRTGWVSVSYLASTRPVAPVVTIPTPTTPTARPSRQTGA